VLVFYVVIYFYFFVYLFIQIFICLFIFIYLCCDYQLESACKDAPRRASIYAMVTQKIFADTLDLYQRIILTVSFKIGIFTSCDY